jgi:precorrin-6A/cobalt-precorrin-6A reductase
VTAPAGRPILVLGGTTEARNLATSLHRAGLPVVSSLAGRVSRPHLPPGEVRIGGFGGADGLARWLREHNVSAVVDATHPFAEQITEAAIAACRETGVPLLRLDRPSWSEPPGAAWKWVDSLATAAEIVFWTAERIFLTIGRQGVSAFAEVDRSWFLIRSVEPPEPPLPPRSMVVLDRGPFTLQGEMFLMRRYLIGLLMTRDSGGTMTEPKLEAARRLGIPVVVVRRPPHPNIETVHTVEVALAWVAALTGQPVQDAPAPAAAES